MKRSSLFLLLLIFGFSPIFLHAQQNADDPVLLTVAGEKITKSEFLNVYMKNNVKGENFDRASLEEYLELYINFRLKVREAESLGMDTLTSFITELAGYRKQLAQPYLTDKSVDDDLLNEAYQRMLFDIRASHILIRVEKNALPEDTLAAYKKIMKLRERIMKGESFAKVAAEASEDHSAQDREDPNTKTTIKGNGGDLGYFTVLDMIYPFESGAYNTKVGSISMPVRTDYGYHIIRVTDRKPAMGKAQVAHIFIRIPTDAGEAELSRLKTRADSTYNAIRNGASFDELVKLISDDKGSAAKGGVLPAFGVNRMVPEFIEAVASLKNTGDISAPVKTSYGWHIIKLLDRKPPKTYEEEKAQLKVRVSKDGRAFKSKDAVVARIRSEYGFREFPETRKDFYNIVDTTIFEAKWDVGHAAGLNKPMFTLGEKTYSQADFAKFLVQKQTRRNKTDIAAFVNERYFSFAEEATLDYEDARLESKYPEFRALMKEYRDGILLFELTDQKVWSKAIKDTTGLQNFYEKNKNNYLWDERLDASIYTCADIKTAKAARKMAARELKGKITEKEILAFFNSDTARLLKIENKKFLKKENTIIDSIAWKKGITAVISKDKHYIFVSVRGAVGPEPKTIKEAKGVITADYQAYLEKEWIAELRSKYSWEVNKNVFESLIK